MKYQIEIPEHDLPALSNVALAALELCKQPDVTSQKIEALIRQDPALTGRLLHIANSPFYKRRVETRTIADAAVRLGLSQLRNIILSAATGELFNASDANAHALWLHSQNCAIFSQLLAEEIAEDRASDAYIGGLMHDIGAITIYLQFPQVYAAVLDQHFNQRIPLLSVEEEVFEYFNHTIVGGLVVRKWQLPTAIADCARFHHEVMHSAVPVLEDEKLVYIVSCADYLADEMGSDSYDADLLLSSRCGTALKLSAAQLEKVSTRYNERMNLKETA